MCNVLQWSGEGSHPPTRVMMDTWIYKRMKWPLERRMLVERTMLESKHSFTKEMPNSLFLLDKYRKSIARKEPKHSHLGRTSATRGKIKKDSQLWSPNIPYRTYANGVDSFNIGMGFWWLSHKADNPQRTWGVFMWDTSQFVQTPSTIIETMIYLLYGIESVMFCTQEKGKRKIEMEKKKTSYVTTVMN